MPRSVCTTCKFSGNIDKCIPDMGHVAYSPHHTQCQHCGLLQQQWANGQATAIHKRAIAIPVTNMRPCLQSLLLATVDHSDLGFDSKNIMITKSSKKNNSTFEVQVLGERTSWEIRSFRTADCRFGAPGLACLDDTNSRHRNHHLRFWLQESVLNTTAFVLGLALSDVRGYKMEAVEA